MTVVCDVHCCWEWLECLWVREFWNQSVWVDVQFLLLYPRAQVQVQTPLEPLLNQSVVKRNVPHLVERRRDKVERLVFFMQLLPLFFFFLTQQKFFRRVVRLTMPRQFGLHRCNVNDTSFLNGATGPCVIQLFLLLLLILVVFVPLDPATEQSIKNFVDLHLLPLGGHEVAFAGGMRVEWHGVVVVELVRVVGGGDGFGGHFSASDSVDDFELLISEVDILHVEFVTNGPPPIFIF